MEGHADEFPSSKGQRGIKGTAPSTVGIESYHQPLTAMTKDFPCVGFKFTYVSEWNTKCEITEDRGDSWIAHVIGCKGHYWTMPKEELECGLRKNRFKVSENKP